MYPRLCPVLTHQFRELTGYLRQFNELQLDRLRAVCCDGHLAEHFLCDLVRRFVDEEHVRRYRRPEPVRYLTVREQPSLLLVSAAHQARRLAAALADESPDRLTRAELLPLSVFLEQLSARLDACTPDAAAPVA